MVYNEIKYGWVLKDKVQYRRTVNINWSIFYIDPCITYNVMYNGSQSKIRVRFILYIVNIIQLEHWLIILYNTIQFISAIQGH